MELDRSSLQSVRHYYQVSCPEGRKGRLPLLVALHGYAGDMVSMLRLAKSIAGEAMAVASLQGPHQFLNTLDRTSENRKVCFGWLTPFNDEESRARHHQAILDAIADLTRNFEADPDRIFLMGFSQACALNYRFAFTHPTVLRGVIGVCGGVPGDFGSNPHYRSTQAGILHVATTHDQYYHLDRTRSFEAALRRFASDVVYQEYEAPHVFPRSSIPFVREWILNHC